jgi:hypothetical protein
LRGEKDHKGPAAATKIEILLVVLHEEETRTVSPSEKGHGKWKDERMELQAPPPVRSLTQGLHCSSARAVGGM